MTQTAQCWDRMDGRLRCNMLTYVEIEDWLRPDRQLTLGMAERSRGWLAPPRGCSALECMPPSCTAASAAYAAVACANATRGTIKTLAAQKKRLTRAPCAYRAT